MRTSPFIVLLIVVIFSIGCKEPKSPDTSAVDGQQKGPVEMERVVAEVGVAKQGRVIGDKEGFLRTPVKALFTAKQKVAFEFKVKPAVNLYEAENGFKPKTHEEFMEKIIKFNEIEVPELPAGHSYVWDPKVGELMVDRPKGE